jgi:hypothetical protein
MDVGSASGIMARVFSRAGGVFVGLVHVGSVSDSAAVMLFSGSYQVIHFQITSL